MESIPKLGHNEKILSAAKIIINRSLNALTNLLFISIITCTVKESISVFDRIVNNVRT